MELRARHDCDGTLVRRRWTHEGAQPQHTLNSSCRVRELRSIVEADGLCSANRLLCTRFERINAALELFSRDVSGHRQQANWIGAAFDCPRLDSVGAIAHERTGQARQLLGDRPSDPRISKRGKHDPTGSQRLQGAGKT